MKPKINSKQRCKICFGYYRYNRYNFYSEDICMACDYESLIGKLLIRGKWNKLPKYILKAIKSRKKELK